MLFRSVDGPALMHVWLHHPAGAASRIAIHVRTDPATTTVRRTARWPWQMWRRPAWPRRTHGKNERNTRSLTKAQTARASDLNQQSYCPPNINPGSHPVWMPSTRQQPGGPEMTCGCCTYTHNDYRATGTQRNRVHSGPVDWNRTDRINRFLISNTVRACMVADGENDNRRPQERDAGL